MTNIKHHLIASSLLIAGTISTPLLAQTRVNVAHLAPFSNSIEETAVSVNVNGAQAIPTVTYGQNSGYLDVGSGGTVVIDVFAPPSAASPAITATAGLTDGNDYTVAAIGDVSNQGLELLLLEDDVVDNPNVAQVRVVHAAPFSANLDETAVSIRLDDGTVVNGLDSVSYTASSGFFPLDPGVYDLKVSSPDGNTTFIDLPPLTLSGGDVVTLFAIGDGLLQPLGIYATFGDGSGVVIELENTITMNPGLNGAWFNPATNGQGFFLDVLPANETVFLSWFTFDSTTSTGTATVGALEQRWLTAQGTYNGNLASLVISNSTGGIFDDSATVTTSNYGTMTLSFSDCSTGEIQYQLAEPGLTGIIPIQRVASDNVELCNLLSD